MSSISGLRVDVNLDSFYVESIEDPRDQGDAKVAHSEGGQVDTEQPDAATISGNNPRYEFNTSYCVLKCTAPGVYVLRAVDDKATDGRHDLSAITAKISALKREGAIFNLQDGKRYNMTKEFVFKQILDDLNSKSQRVSSSFCPPIRTLLRFLGFAELPTPLFFELGADSKTKCEVDYMKTFKRNIEDDGVTNTTRFPFLTYLIDRFVESGTYVIDNKASFCSLEGRLSCLKNAGVQLITSLFMLVISTMCLAFNWSKFQAKERGWILLDAPLGIILSPLFPFLSSVKYLAAGIFHPGAVYTKLDADKPKAE